jgi:hypothetical protein
MDKNVQYTHYPLKFVNPSFKPSNGIDISNTRLRTNDGALSSHKFFLLRPYSLMNTCFLIWEFGRVAGDRWATKGATVGTQARVGLFNTNDWHENNK